MDNSDMPAMPSSNPPSPGLVAQCKAVGIPVPKLQMHQGLTKREYFAAKAMPVFIELMFNEEDTAKSAVEYADALLAELEK